MSYQVLIIDPKPETEPEMQDEINNATSDDSKLVSIAVDGTKLIIVVEK